MNINYAGTSYNATVILTALVGYEAAIPVPIEFDGFSTESILEMDDVNDTKVDAGLGFDYQFSLIPVVWKATITLFGGSPTLLLIQAIKGWERINATKAIGVLTITIPVIKTLLIANPVCIFNNPQISLKDNIQPVKIMLSGAVPIVSPLP